MDTRCFIPLTSQEPLAPSDASATGKNTQLCEVFFFSFNPVFKFLILTSAALYPGRHFIALNCLHLPQDCETVQVVNYNTQQVLTFMGKINSCIFISYLFLYFSNVLVNSSTAFKNIGFLLSKYCVISSVSSLLSCLPLQYSYVYNISRG